MGGSAMVLTSLVWSLAILVLLAPIPAAGEPPMPTRESAPAPATPTAIPVAEVATRAAEASGLLRSIGVGRRG